MYKEDMQITNEIHLLFIPNYIKDKNVIHVVQNGYKNIKISGIF